MERTLYIHFPFCIRKCVYCDFLSVPHDSETAERYVSALCSELSLKKGLAGQLKTIYIGGGTPSLLTAGQIAKLLDCITGNYRVSSDAEISLEANPGTLGGTSPGILRAVGINRISIGVQSFSDVELKILGRIHSAVEAEAAIRDTGKCGFQSVSLDLMYGIPGQTMASWRETLARATGLGPDHISTYELTPEKDTPLSGLLSSGIVGLPDEDLVIDMYNHAIDFLESKDFRHYEISNFALPGHESRHNLNYWNRGEYIGIGAGAHSCINNRRSCNTGDISRYIARLSGGQAPDDEEEPVSPEEALREYIFLGLRKSEGLCLTDPALSGVTLITASQNLVETGYLRIDRDNMSLTRKGLVVSNMVIVNLITALGL